MPASQRASRPSTEALRAPDRSRLYEQLAARLLDYVEVTGLRVGGRLPSERDLAAALKVSRASVRQATIALEVRGTLEVRHGDGIYLRSLPNESGHLMELMTQRHRLPAILEAREALETQLAALAAARRTTEDVAEMSRALDVMAADIEADGFGEEGDRLFHEAVTRAARSPMLADFMAGLCGADQRDQAQLARRAGTPAAFAARPSPDPGGHPARGRARRAPGHAPAREDGGRHRAAQVGRRSAGRRRHRSHLMPGSLIWPAWMWWSVPSGGRKPVVKGGDGLPGQDVA